MLPIEQLLYDFLPKVVLAILCGSLLGIERELKEKPAGLRTYLLITIGACLFQIIGTEISKSWLGAADPGRVAAQVVTGIGFLGAGAIIQSKGEVRGLTTAATIWFAAGVGVAVGAALYILAVFVTLVAVAALVLLRKLERALGTKGRMNYRCVIATTSPEAFDAAMNLLAREPTKVKVLESKRLTEICEIAFECHLSTDELRDLQRALTSPQPGEVSLRCEMLHE
ncbi:MAG: MgtC/SapB family protein [Candidatus Thermoplasmatota archaeon]